MGGPVGFADVREEGDSDPVSRWAFIFVGATFRMGLAVRVWSSQGLPEREPKAFRRDDVLQVCLFGVCLLGMVTFWARGRETRVPLYRRRPWSVSVMGRDGVCVCEFLRCEAWRWRSVSGCWIGFGEVGGARREEWINAGIVCCDVAVFGGGWLSGEKVWMRRG